MRTAKNVLSFGAFAVIIVITVSYIASFGVHKGPPDDRLNLSMDVPDVKGLVVGSSVLLRGVPVGKVTGIDASVHAATVDFYVTGDQRIPVDSEVRLDNLSALGEAYIGLMPRTDTGPVLTDGEHIATESIVAPPSISELSTSVVRVLNQSDPVQLARTVNEVDLALPDPDVVLPNLARAGQLFRNMVVSMDGRGQEVLANFQTLLQNADWVGPALADIAPGVRAAGEGIEGTYVGMMKTVAWNNPANMALFQQFLGRIQAFLDTRGPDVKVLTQALTPQFRGIGGALMNFDTGRMLSNALSGIPEEGAITLRVTIPDR
ncbi:MlaD family protein [Mycolicibacterium parafortuitum]|uniref:ABC-type transport system involved in resistance to organic solvents, periplasmic component [Gordonia sp. KTR9] n=1 Tax=Mycolicibacterium parafortuitum TaxID=39692 RepID=A0A375YEU4_MYCPF|nr:MlaD family protein [Mycolicibacterium parafortuitum]ORB30101.1 mammalian cell entry protein [Mycolicibacterium parafortuitum]SRX79599.1 ABC-type transport system involved in resistance to organic solvents, periplasmic component [Gordonia sp. KTR9] [Mycolicibacterium parafortuitum]